MNPRAISASTVDFAKTSAYLPLPPIPNLILISSFSKFSDRNLDQSSYPIQKDLHSSRTSHDESHMIQCQHHAACAISQVASSPLFDFSDSIPREAPVQNDTEKLALRSCALKSSFG